MKRIVVTGFALLTLLAGLGCASGDKPAPAGTAAGAAPTETSTMALTPAATAEPSATASAAGASDGASFVSTLLGRALGGGATGGAADLGAGDPALNALVLKQSDLPAGYRVVQTFNSRVSDGISISGTADLAASIASSGDFQSGAGSMLMSMVMRFSDLQDLDRAFGQLNADALKAQLASAGDESYAGLFKDVHALDTGDLGDHATGISMTMDLGSLFGAIAGAIGDGSGTPVALPSGVPTAFTIHMYIFARGSYAGALMRIYADSPGPRVDELALARVVDERLGAAR